MKYCMILFGFLIFIFFIQYEINSNPIELIEENDRSDDLVHNLNEFVFDTTEEYITSENFIVSTAFEEDGTKKEETLTEDLSIHETVSEQTTDETPIIIHEDDHPIIDHTTDKLSEIVTEAITENLIEKNEIINNQKEKESKEIKQLLNRLSNQLQLPNDNLAAYHYITAMKSADGSIYVPQNHRLSTRKHLATLLGFAEEIVASKNALAQNTNEEESIQEVNHSTNISEEQPTELSTSISTPTELSDITLITEDSSIQNETEIITEGSDENELIHTPDISTTEIWEEYTTVQDFDLMNQTSINISTDSDLDDKEQLSED